MENPEVMKEKVPEAGGDVYYSYGVVTNPQTTGETWIMIGLKGILYVSLGATSWPETIYVRHNNGTTSDINVGNSAIPVDVGDHIVYRLSDPLGDRITLRFTVL